MNFLLDTDTCSAHMRRSAKPAHRFNQHAGDLAISTIVLAELYAGAFKHPNPSKLLPFSAVALPTRSCTSKIGLSSPNSLFRGMVSR